MKRIIVITLIITLILSGNIVLFAEEDSTARYSTIQVEFSDNVGQTEKLNVMVKDEHVYANAGELASRLGYGISISDNNDITIFNMSNSDLPYGFTQFFNNDRKVRHMLFSNMLECYEAPFESAINDKGAWIPLEYSLLILNSGMLMVEDTLLIDMPEKKIIDSFLEILRKEDVYPFDWGRDFGYTESDVSWQNGAHYRVNLLNGIITLDGDTWKEIFQSLSLDPNAYDSKYGENIALLLCTESKGELEQVKKDAEKYQDIFSENGKIGKMLSTYSDAVDTEVGVLYTACENILDDIEEGNSSVAIYNRAYDALEKAFDKQTWFSETGGRIIETQRAVSKAVSPVEIGSKVMEVVQYGEEFQNQDQLSVEAVELFLNNSVVEGLVIPEAMKSSMEEYVSDLKGDMFEYSAKKYFDENIDKWIGDAIKDSKLLGSQANMALIAWDLASNYVPFISNGLNAANQFEMALYSTLLQSDTANAYRNYSIETFTDETNITPERLYELSKYCFVYLKTCYVTRNAAIASLIGKSENMKEQIQPLVDYQNDINSEIAEKLVILKKAETSNKKLVYGFLPSDNQKYLTKYNDSNLITWIDTFSDDKKVEMSESELLGITESITGHVIETYVYTDMDHDGTNELISAFCDNSGLYQAWYCSSDGKTCVLVHQDDEEMEICRIETLNIGNETHIVLNTCRTMGSNKNYSIIALKDKKAKCLLCNKYGYVSMANSGEIVLNVESYDEIYDHGVGPMVRHTMRDTYLFFDGNEYKEYGATEISENEFMEFQNSKETKDKIIEKLKQSGIISFEFVYYRRQNGIVHVQCNVCYNSEKIPYGYYTIRYDGNQLSDDLVKYNAGQMEPNFSDLQVEY